jgi:type III pantothenate kinase
MTWYVDIGNSSIKWAQLKAKELTPSERYQRTTAGHAEDLDAAWGNLSSPKELVCSCVAGESFEQAMITWCQQVWGITPVFIRTTQQAMGVTNAYVNPEQLGVDRWAAMIAAHQMNPKACCVVDCGTATTVDVVESNGQHMGGLIIPGNQLMADSLLDKTAITATESEGDNSTLFARHTADAIKGGALYATVATIDRVYTDVATALGKPIEAVITGGGAEEILPLLSLKPTYEADLVLQGVRLIHQAMSQETV